MDNQLSSDLYRLLLEQLLEGIIITDAEGKIIFVNPAAEQIRNLKKEDILQHNVLGCHTPASHEKVTRAIEFLRAHPDKTYHRMVNDQLNKKVYENTYAGIYDTAKSMLGMAVITRDVTEKRRVEEMQATSTRAQEIELENMRLQYHQLLMTSMEALTNVLEARDEYTNGHSKRVAEIASKLYEHRYGITGTYLDIQWAAKLHDIGKICIPDAIINKPGKLTNEEYELVKNHSRIAADILKSLDPGERLIPAILHHHERFDGKGYPAGLAGYDIPLGSRIIAIADTYDAMSSCRPYRRPVPYESCIDEIRSNAGKQFDPEWVDVFLDLADTGSID